MFCEGSNPFIPNFAVWCNGSTSDSDSEGHGSSPCTAVSGVWCSGSTRGFDPCGSGSSPDTLAVAVAEWSCSGLWIRRYGFDSRQSPKPGEKGPDRDS